MGSNIMNISLKSMLEGATAIPYSDALINILEDSCHMYKSEDAFGRVDELVVAFVKGDIPVSFRNHIRSVMREQDFNEIPTDEVFVRLAQYVVLVTILENEDELYRSICASKLMNYMLVAKALRRPIPNMKELLWTYDYHLSAYLRSLDMLHDNKQSSLRSEVPDAEFPLEVSEEDAQTLRLVFKESELYRIERLLMSEDIQKIENPFERVYVGLRKMFDGLPYYYYDLDLSRIIGLLIGSMDGKKRKKLSNIVNDIVQSGYVVDDAYCETSVILGMIDGKEEGVVGDIMLSIKEFTVYLYYEILTEKIISIQN